MFVIYDNVIEGGRSILASAVRWQHATNLMYYKFPWELERGPLD